MGLRLCTSFGNECAFVSGDHSGGRSANQSRTTRQGDLRFRGRGRLEMSGLRNFHPFALTVNTLGDGRYARRRAAILRHRQRANGVRFEQSEEENRAPG